MTDGTIIDTTATEVPPREPIAPLDPIGARLAPIRSAIAAGASADVRRAALDPLRIIYAEILASLDPVAIAAPVPTFAAPTFAAPSSHPLRGMSIDQVLDLVIAQLRAVAGDGASAAAGGPLAQLLGGAR